MTSPYNSILNWPEDHNIFRPFCKNIRQWLDVLEETRALYIKSKYISIHYILFSSPSPPTSSPSTDTDTQHGWMVCVLAIKMSYNMTCHYFKGSCIAITSPLQHVFNKTKSTLYIRAGVKDANIHHLSTSALFCPCFDWYCVVLLIIYVSYKVTQVLGLRDWGFNFLFSPGTNI